MEEERKEMKKKANSYASALNLTGWLILVIGLIGSFYLGDVFSIEWNYNYGVLLAGALSSTCAGVLLLGLGEIIKILDDSRNHIRKIAGSTSEQKEEFHEESEF